MERVLCLFVSDTVNRFRAIDLRAQLLPTLMVAVVAVVIGEPVSGKDFVSAHNAVLFR